MLISISHDCPFCYSGHKNRCFARYHNGYKCFSCGACKIDNKRVSFKEKTKTKINLPHFTRCVKEFSLGNLAYLYERGMTEALIYKYGIVQSDSGSLLFLPKIDGAVAYYVEKNVTTGYTTASGTKPLCILGKGSAIVLVEDYLSSIAIAEAGFASMCLFGTILSNQFAKHLLSCYTDIHTWLDPDEPGQQGAEGIKKRLDDVAHYMCMRQPLRVLSYRVKNIESDKDPKYYTKSEIKEIINA